MKKQNYCGNCINCQDRQRWYTVYWKPYLENGGDKKWVTRQIELDATLKCRNVPLPKSEIESEMLYAKAMEK